jgi:hypothetical protein
MAERDRKIAAGISHRTIRVAELTQFDWFLKRDCAAAVSENQIDVVNIAVSNADA